MKAKEIVFRILGLGFCTVPPIVAILLYFPIWKNEGGASMLSGFALLLLVLALTPLFNTLKALFRTPSAYVMWFIIFVAFLLLSEIAHEMTVIAFVGFVGNVIGAFLLRLGGVRGKSGEKDT